MKGPRQIPHLHLSFLRGPRAFILTEAPCARPPPRKVQTNLSESPGSRISPLLVDNAVLFGGGRGYP